LTDLNNLISAAVAAKMTPDFIDKEVATRVDKLIVESIDRALRSYSETGKLIEKAIEDALRVDRIDLPSYGSTVLSILKAQIEAVVAPLVAGQLAKDMEEVLHLAPKEVKLSQIADEMRKRHEGEGWGPVITVEVERTEYGSAWVYLDEREHYEDRAQHKAEHRLLVGKDGVISGGWIGGRPMQDGAYVGRSYGLAQKIRAYVACGTKIILDEDAVVTSVGDY
jgi:hypothetical protein